MVIDTNVIVAAMRGDLGASRFVVEANLLLVPTIVEAELWYGIHRTRRSEEEARKVQAFLADCTILPLTSDIARAIARVRSQLDTAGTPIPPNDLIIAATALAMATPLVTRDIHFGSVPGLEIVHLPG